MKMPGSALALAAGILFATVSSQAQNQRSLAHGRAIVTVLPAHPGPDAPGIAPRDVHIKVDGKPAAVASWTPLHGAADRTELVLLIDDSARSSLANELSDLADFAKEVPSHTQMAVAYMQNGRAAFAGPFSANPAQIVRGLRVPMNSAGQNGSPYFCLSDLALHWPSHDAEARRVVLMITDGVDEYEPRYDPDDPYVLEATNSSLRAGLLVYAIYWPNRGGAGNSAYETSAGQNLLAQVAEATGGVSFWLGFGNPVSLQPYLQELRQRLRHQYLLRLDAPASGKPSVASLQVKIGVPSVKVDAPRQVYIAEGSGTAQ